MSTENNDELAGVISGFAPPSTLALFDSKTSSLYTSIIIILKVYPVLVLILGSFGNILSFCVLLRAAMRRYSTFCYLACLALVDLGVIITFCVNFISLYHFHYDIQIESFPCKLFAFSIYFLPQYSSWILVAVSIDRVISAKYLRLAKTWSKPKHSVLVTCLLGLFLAVLNSHFFLYENNSFKQRNQQQQQRILQNDSVIERYLSPKTFTDRHGQFTLITSFSNSESIGTGRSGDRSIGNTLSQSYEPFTTLSSPTVTQERTLRSQYDNLITMKQDSIPFFDVNVLQCSLENSIDHSRFYVYWVWIDLAMNVFIPFTAMIACTIIIILTLVRSSSRSGSTSVRRSRRRRNISVMLITVNLVFILLTAPIVIFLSVYEYVKDDRNLYRQTILVLIKIFCIILMNVNHSINIVIYSVTAKEFRTEMGHFLQAVLYCIIGKPSTSSDLPYIHDDGTLLSRLRHLRRNLFTCCRVKLHSTNLTDSSTLQHTTAVGLSHRSSVPINTNKRQRSERNGKKKYSITFNSEISNNKNNRRLIVQLPPEPTSSIYEHEDQSFHGLSISTEDEK